MSAVAAELRKIATTRLWWIVLLCVFFLGGGYAVLPAVIALLQESTGPGSVAVVAEPFRDPPTLLSVYNGGNTLSRILALVVGVMAMGGEYRHKTMATTYLAVPRRGHVVAAKAASLFVYGLLYGAASVLAGGLVAIPFVLVQDGSFFLDRADTWRSLLLGVVSVALWTLIGMGIGTLIRTMLSAMLVGVGFAYVLEPALTVLFFIQQWNVPLNLMPSGATNAMLGVTSPILFASPDPWPWWQGLLVLSGWCLLPAALGALITVRRDVD